MMIPGRQSLSLIRGTIMNDKIQLPDIKELRQFGLMMGAFIAGIFGLLIPWVWGLSIVKWPWIVASIFVGFAIIAPALLKPVFIGWMKFATVLGWVNTRIILFIIFFFLFFPMALLLKAIGWDAMHRSLKKKMDTYRVKSAEINREDMEKPF